MAHTEKGSMESKLERRYSLKTVFGVTNLLRDIHHLRDKRFVGSDTTFISCILIDFEMIIKKARLTKRQIESLYYHYELDLTQQETSRAMGISQQAVSKHLDNAVAKIVIAAKESEHLGGNKPL